MGHIYSSALNEAEMDTGWVRINPTDSNFKTYGSNQDWEIRRVGSIVQMRGALTVVSGILTDSTNGPLIMTLDEKFRPNGRTCFVNHGSNGNKFQLLILSSGSVYIGRYADHSSKALEVTTGNNIPSSVWLRMDAMYVVG